MALGFLTKEPTALKEPYTLKIPRTYSAPCTLIVQTIYLNLAYPGCWQGSRKASRMTGRRRGTLQEGFGALGFWAFRGLGFRVQDLKVLGLWVLGF